MYEDDSHLIVGGLWPDDQADDDQASGEHDEPGPGELAACGFCDGPLDEVAAPRPQYGVFNMLNFWEKWEDEAPF